MGVRAYRHCSYPSIPSDNSWYIRVSNGAGTCRPPSLRRSMMHCCSHVITVCTLDALRGANIPAHPLCPSDNLKKHTARGIQVVFHTQTRLYARTTRSFQQTTKLTLSPRRSTCYNFTQATIELCSVSRHPCGQCARVQPNMKQFVWY